MQSQDRPPLSVNCSLESVRVWQPILELSNRCFIAETNVPCTWPCSNQCMTRLYWRCRSHENVTSLPDCKHSCTQQHLHSCSNRHNGCLLPSRKLQMVVQRSTLDELPSLPEGSHCVPPPSHLQHTGQRLHGEHYGQRCYDCVATGDCCHACQSRPEGVGATVPHEVLCRKLVPPAKGTHHPTEATAELHVHTIELTVRPLQYMSTVDVPSQSVGCVNWMCAQAKWQGGAKVVHVVSYKAQLHAEKTSYH